MSTKKETPRSRSQRSHTTGPLRAGNEDLEVLVSRPQGINGSMVSGNEIRDTLKTNRFF